MTQHIAAIYDEGELAEPATCKDFLQVRSEGARQVERSLKHYNLDVIISVGYRVRSHRGTQFRIWATERLREYLIKGFAMDDERLKRAGGGNYFEELLASIRDIRSSERVFWRKVLDIYATSIDYDPKAESSLLLFKTIQNKMHWAAHGHTAAEVIHARADASQPNMGLTTWDGAKPRKTDVSIAKNYLKQDEIEALNRIVTAYLEFAKNSSPTTSKIRPSAQFRRGGMPEPCQMQSRSIRLVHLQKGPLPLGWKCPICQLAWRVRSRGNTERSVRARNSLTATRSSPGSHRAWKTGKPRSSTSYPVAWSERDRPNTLSFVRNRHARRSSLTCSLVPMTFDST